MSQVLLVATSDARRAVQVAFERWNPDLWDVQQVAILPRRTATGEALRAELLDETIVQIQRLTPQPIRVVTERRGDQDRDLRSLAELQGVELQSFEDPEVEAWLNAAYRIELVSAAGIPEDGFPGLALAPREVPAAAPNLVLLDALEAPTLPNGRPAEVLSMSSDPVAIDLVAAGLYRALRGSGFAAVGALTALPPFRTVSVADSLPLRFETDGAPAREYARLIQAELGQD